MLKLPSTLGNHLPDSLKKILKKELESLPAGVLPLENGLTQGGYVDDNNITATVLNVSEQQSVINARVGVFFTEIVGGCNCNDDPFEINAYCEIIISIHKSTSEADVVAISD